MVCVLYTQISKGLSHGGEIVISLYGPQWQELEAVSGYYINNVFVFSVGKTSLRLKSSQEWKSLLRYRRRLDRGVQTGNVELIRSGIRGSLRFFCGFAVPPSQPSCSHSGQTSVGGSVALRCSSSEGAPKPVYNWEHLGSSPTPPPGSMVQGERAGHWKMGLET